jgi:hypothetical protein
MLENEIDQTKPSHGSIKLLKMVYTPLVMGCPFQMQKEKRAGLQFTSTDRMSLVSTLLRICWTIPLRSSGSTRFC